MVKLIVLMGGQGVGKGTFARILCEQHDYKYIETGAMLRNAAQQNPKIAEILNRGELLPNDILLNLMTEQISGTHDILLDGFPRTLDQAKWLVQNYADKFNIHVLYLDVPEEIMIARIQKRIREGGGRADDADVDAVRKRLDIFWNTTIPAIKWLETVPGIKFSDVDVRGNVNENMKNITLTLSD